MESKVKDGASRSTSVCPAWILVLSLATASAVRISAQPVAPTAPGSPRGTRTAEPNVAPIEMSTQPLSPEVALQRIRMPPGFRLELVASEPLVEEPVTLSWDADGRLYVVEMRGYMQNVDGTGEQELVGRIARLEDIDGDGRMDRRTTFLDGLVEPRAVLVLDREVLVGEPPTLWLASDRDDDGVAEMKKPFYEPYDTRKGQVEGKASGLMWSIDNWIYNAKFNRRLRYRNGEAIAEPTPIRGQWGAAQDDTGNLYWSTAGTPFINEPIRAEYWSRYSDLTQHPLWFTPESILRQFSREVRPIVSTPDAQGGHYMMDRRGALNRFTAAGGQTIFRGDRVPALAGNYLVTEPVGRLVRRGVFVDHEETPSLINPHEPGEFLASRARRKGSCFVVCGCRCDYPA